MNEVMDYENTTNEWVSAEQNFMRYTGAAMLVIGVVSIFFGVLANPNGENFITMFNLAMTFILFLWGAWTLWRSTKTEKIQESVQGANQRSADTTRAIGIVQVVIGIMFGLEGLSGNITLLLLALVLFYSAWWTNQRRSRSS